MAMGTTHPPTAEEQDQAPPDVEVMRESACLLLGPDGAPDVLPPAPAGLDSLTTTLRGHLVLLAPEVEQVAARLHKDSIPRYCALACVGEARGKLRAEAGPGLHGAVAYARRLARCLNALCDHYDKLSGAAS